jgi:integrase
MQLHTADGTRKYLTAGERDAFLREADLADRPVRTLCMTLAYAGCRLSEALALTADRVDLAAGVLVFESLKKRRAGVFRSVPVPPALLDTCVSARRRDPPSARMRRGPIWEPIHNCRSNPNGSKPTPGVNHHLSDGERILHLLCRAETKLA